jgi:hypothetical protein
VTLFNRDRRSRAIGLSLHRREITLHKLRASSSHGLVLSTHDPVDILANRIWFTRKAWINAENRLLSNEFHTQLLMVVYSAYTTCLAVILLAYEPQPKDKKFVDTSLAVLSIILLALSLYLNSKSFKDRAARFKIGYHDLQEIESEVNSIALISPASQQELALADCNRRYNKVLRDVENHAELDDIAARIGAGAGLRLRPLTTSNIFRYRLWRTSRFVSLVLMYSAPLLAVIGYFLST